VLGSFGNVQCGVVLGIYIVVQCWECTVWCSFGNVQCGVVLGMHSVM